MDSLSSVNQLFIQQQAGVQPAQYNPTPVNDPAPQVDLTQEPDVFVPSKKSHKKAILGIGALVAAGVGLFALAKTGKLTFTGKGQQEINGAIPNEIVNIKNDALAAASEIQEKAKGLITQCRNIQARADEIQAASKQELDEVVALIQKGAANQFQDGGNIRFTEKTNKKGELIQRIMEEIDGDKIARRTFFTADDMQQVIEIDKGIEKIADGEKISQKFNFFDGRLREFSEDVITNPNSEKTGQCFAFGKDNSLTSWHEDYSSYPDAVEYKQAFFFLENGKGGSWHNGYKSKEEVVSGITKRIDTQDELLMFNFDENNNVIHYEKGSTRVSSWGEDGHKSANSFDEEFDFRDNKLDSWTKDYKMDEDGNQKRAYWMFCDDGVPSNISVGSTEPMECEAYYKF